MTAVAELRVDVAFRGGAKNGTVGGVNGCGNKKNKRYGGERPLAYP
jgi:hypothetical protein